MINSSLKNPVKEMEEGRGEQEYEDEGFENGSESVASDSKDDADTSSAQTSGQVENIDFSPSASHFVEPCDPTSSKDLDDGSSKSSGNFPGIQNSQGLADENALASGSSELPVYQVEPIVKDIGAKSVTGDQKVDSVQHANENGIHEGTLTNETGKHLAFEEIPHEKATMFEEKLTSVETSMPREHTQPSPSIHTARPRSEENHLAATEIHNLADGNQREETLAQDERGRVFPYRVGMKVAFAEHGTGIPAAPTKRDDVVRPPPEETLAQQRASIAKIMRKFVRVNVEVFVEYCTAKRSGHEVHCERQVKEGSTLRGTHEAYHDLYERLRTALAGREFLLNPERVVVFANHSCLSELSRASNASTGSDTAKVAQKQATRVTAVNRSIMTNDGGLPIAQEAGAGPAPKSPPRLRTWGEGTSTTLGNFETTGLQHSHVHRHFPRLGAFEVWVRVFSSDALELVASKLTTGQFPTGIAYTGIYTTLCPAVRV